MPLGLIENWLRYIPDTQERHRPRLSAFVEASVLDRLYELNVLHQAHKVWRTTAAQDALKRALEVVIHAWIRAPREHPFPLGKSSIFPLLTHTTS